MFPLSNLLATKQIRLGDLISVGVNPEDSKLTFVREEQGALVGAAAAASSQTALVPVSTEKVAVQALAVRMSVE